jgi:hypothetical protein
MRRFIGCWIALSLYGQQVSIEPRPRAEPANNPKLRIETSLVLVPLTVTDKLGRPVLGLEKEIATSFRIRLRTGRGTESITRFASNCCRRKASEN